MRSEFYQLIDRFRRPSWFSSELETGGAIRPHIESFTEEGKLVVRADMPGIDPKNIEVSWRPKKSRFKSRRAKARRASPRHGNRSRGLGSAKAAEPCEAEERSRFHGLVGKTPAMRDLYQRIEAVDQARAMALLQARAERAKNWSHVQFTKVVPIARHLSCR
jgi:hypothetical protein